MRSALIDIPPCFNYYPCIFILFPIDSNQLLQPSFSINESNVNVASDQSWQQQVQSIGQTLAQHITKKTDNIQLRQTSFQKQKDLPRHETNKLSIPKISSAKSNRKINQKRNRNVSSNLLRIFMKNVLQTRTFENLINKYIESSKIIITPQHFYQWLLTFKLNYKNYIRFEQFRNIFRESANLRMKKLFMWILIKFADQFGITHTLTSRRIDKRAIKMHLQGLRNLKRQINSALTQQIDF